MKPADGRRIDVSRDGPYYVTGEVPLSKAEIVVDEKGESESFGELERYPDEDFQALCRCGHSCSKPFCDGTHAAIGFDGTETAGHESFVQMAVDINGPSVLLKDAKRLCAEARFCARGAKLWHLVEMCDDPEARSLAIREAMLCPSGRYVLCEQGEQPHEPAYQPSIVVLEDPSKGVAGPLFVRGGIPVYSSKGEPYEVRNRVTLCRCGASRNKPFCDGMHLKVKFRDDDPPAEE